MPAGVSWQQPAPLEGGQLSAWKAGETLQRMNAGSVSSRVGSGRSTSFFGNGRRKKRLSWHQKQPSATAGGGISLRRGVGNHSPE